MADINELRKIIEPHRQPDRQFYLDLLDEDRQRQWEELHLSAVLSMLKVMYVGKLTRAIKEAKEERASIISAPDYNAEKYRRVLELDAEIRTYEEKRQSYKCFFDETYFARMDLEDDEDGYNSYYIGKHGDEGLEIVDWRAPLARRYYQKSKLSFSINQFNYRLVLRRSLRTHNGRLEDFKNEYLSVGDNLTEKEIAGRDASVVFDPFLKEILQSRKEKDEICDIIETIQEKQYEIITAPERAEMAVQGVAGSGKTMILLHRLSYLMYNNEEIKPSSVIVITPSVSFNAFIDELSKILELERVKTMTLEDYFILLLKSAGINIEGRVDGFAPLPEGYLEYLYSEKFVIDADKKLARIYSSVRGMLPGSGDEFIDGVISSLGGCIEAYEKLKNASLRVRRCVLGEIKEKKDGGLFYTKQMRTLFNCVLDVREFLSINGSDKRMDDKFFFFRQFLSFYKSLRFISLNAEKICRTAQEDLAKLRETVQKEIVDLRRYRQKIGDRTVLVYAERIEKREALLKETDAAVQIVEDISYGFTRSADLYAVLRGESYFVRTDRCESMVDLARLLYRETVKCAKKKFGAPVDKLVRGDAYAICLVLARMGYPLTPAYSFVFVDEAQDISFYEYEILRRVNGGACFNVFGDLKQNITPYRGISDWAQLGLPVYELNLNYRNTNQIVSFVSGNLNISMQAIGLGGEEVKTISPRGISAFLADKKGLRAVITSEANLQPYTRKAYNVVRTSGKISKDKINILTVYESKGLEFSAVAVADGDMTDNERYIAYTRALKDLAVVR